MQAVPTITVQQLQEALNMPEPPQVLDVREDPEVTQSALPNILHIPLGQLPNRIDELVFAQPVAVICRSGGRSAAATALLLQEGFVAANVAGGMLAYRAEVDPTLPTVL